MGLSAWKLTEGNILSGRFWEEREVRKASQQRDTNVQQPQIQSLMPLSPDRVDLIHSPPFSQHGPFSQQDFGNSILQDPHRSTSHSVITLSVSFNYIAIKLFFPLTARGQHFNYITGQMGFGGLTWKSHRHLSHLVFSKGNNVAKSKQPKHE